VLVLIKKELITILAIVTKSQLIKALNSLMQALILSLILSLKNKLYTTVISLF
jgi:hypothetical protein